MLYLDRLDAGRVLAEKLDHYRDRPDVLILALPRGGVPVAFEVAKALHAPLDVFLVRKLGMPGHEEFAMGALATGNIRIMNQQALDHLRIPLEVIEETVNREQSELYRQDKIYRHGEPPPQFADRTVILVDDGLATGLTMSAAVQALRQQHPKELVIAVPVGAPNVCASFEAEVDEVICAATPANFHAVSSWYEDFRPVPDELVQALLKEAASLQQEVYA
jgi:putative phosphoribosyl transferase